MNNQAPILLQKDEAIILENLIEHLEAENNLQRLQIDGLCALNKELRALALKDKKPNIAELDEEIHTIKFKFFTICLVFNALLSLPIFFYNLNWINIETALIFYQLYFLFLTCILTHITVTKILFYIKNRKNI